MFYSKILCLIYKFVALNRLLNQNNSNSANEKIFYAWVDGMSARSNLNKYANGELSVSLVS